MIVLDPIVLRRLWPAAPQEVVDAYSTKSAMVFAKYGINTPLRARHFMSQVSHESGGGTIKTESLYYTHAERIADVWPRRFTVESAQPYVRNERALADKVYNSRMGNAEGSDDGFNYRGRGPLQLTGKESYAEIGAIVGLPLVEQPDLAALPTTGLEIAAAEFKKLGCLAQCDVDNIEGVTHLVNGGYIGLASRKSWFARWSDITFDAADIHYVPADPPPLPQVPRGSDDVLPPGTLTPGKTMAGSKTGWATIAATATSVATVVGQMVDQVKPLLADPKTILALVVVLTFLGAFVWFDRRTRLLKDA